MKKSSNLDGGCPFLRQTFTKFSARLRSKKKYIILQRGYFYTFGANCIQRTYTFPAPNHRPTTKFCFSKVPPLQAVLRDVTYESGQSRRPASRRRYYFLGLG